MCQYLDLGSLWKHVERCDRIDLKSLLQFFYVARERWRITGNVHHCFRAEMNDRIADPFSKSCCRWIDDHCCSSARRGERPRLGLVTHKSGRHGSLYTFHIAGDVGFFFARVLSRGGDSKPIPIYPNHALEFVEQGFCEESGTAVSVD